MGRRVQKTLAIPATLALAIVLSGCVDWGESESDAVRRAVIAYELDTRGVRVDDLIVRLSPGDFRADFGRGSRIVWLVSPAYQRQYREQEYFRVRDPARAYLFVEDIVYDDSHNEASVRAVLYLRSGVLTAKEIALHREADSWVVSGDRHLETIAP